MKIFNRVSKLSIRKVPPTVSLSERSSQLTVILKVRLAELGPLGELTFDYI